MIRAGVVTHSLLQSLEPEITAITCAHSAFDFTETKGLCILRLSALAINTRTQMCETRFHNSSRLFAADGDQMLLKWKSQLRC
jgi:hypothetical protein